DHWVYAAPVSASVRGLAGAGTPLPIPCVAASQEAVPSSSSPATVSTPGIVAGAPTSSDPVARLPAATTTTTACSSACRIASSQVSGQSCSEDASEILMTSTS